MDNVTKALLISAAGLIVIVIIALSVKLLNINSDSGKIAGELTKEKTGDASKIALDEIGKAGKKHRTIIIGDVYNLGTESFYVIGTTQETVKLLAVKCVDTRTNKQSDNANKVVYDEGGHNWYNGCTIKTLVESYATNTLHLQATQGRLLKKEEAIDLRDNHQDILYGNATKLDYWLWGYTTWRRWTCYGCTGFIKKNNGCMDYERSKLWNETSY